MLSIGECKQIKILNVKQKREYKGSTIKWHTSKI